MRERLPSRRKNLTTTIRHEGTKFHAQFGFYADGRVGEIFTHGRNVGSAWQALLNDASIAVSNLLQLGLRPEELAKKVCRDDEGLPSSIIGVLIDAAAKLELERDHA